MSENQSAADKTLVTSNSKKDTNVSSQPQSTIRKGQETPGINQSSDKAPVT